MNANEHNKGKGTAAALISAVIWGILPIYWQALRPIDSMVIIFYRITFVGVFCFFLAWKLYGIKEMGKLFKDKKSTLVFFMAGLIITINWSIYIWAVNADFVIQTCIGYYIEPIMVCVFGIIFFREKLDKSKKLALTLVIIGLGIVLIHFKEVPILALALATTFAIYAAIKKSLNVPPVLSLLYETMFLVPFALGVILYLEFNEKGAIGVGAPHQYVLLLFCGILTAIPLGLFSYAANNIPLTSLGIIGYISPSLALALGIFFLKEPFDGIQLLSFCFIWVALIVFTYGEVKQGKDVSSEGR